MSEAPPLPAVDRFDAAAKSTAGDARWPLRFAAAAALTAAADYLLWQSGFAYAAWAAWVVAAAAITPAAIGRLPGRPATVVSIGLIIAGAARLLWQGNPIAVLGCLAATFVLSLACRGIDVTLFRSLIAAATLPFGWIYDIRGVSARRSAAPGDPQAPRRFGAALEIVLPLLVAGTFAMIFLSAHPPAVSAFWRGLEDYFQRFVGWLERLDFEQAFFWVVVAAASVGLSSPWLRPMFAAFEWEKDGEDKPPADATSPLYALARNTLAAVIGVFAAYLVVEFSTLWFHTFPEGFHYSGFAHRGAAWLTLALAMATLLLSAIFRGSIERERRAGTLRRLAWVWSGLNVLLAVTVYHRLWIYVGYNGMTRMRVVGFVGVTCVLAGFLIVVWKIYRRRDFFWLVDRQALALGMAVFSLGLIPMDYLAHRYNARRIARGDLAPAVQLSVHPVSDEGWLAAWPLLDHPDAAIREGLRARLADHYLRMYRSDGDWRRSQQARRLLRARVDRDPERLAPHLTSDAESRRAAADAFWQAVRRWW